MRHIALGIAAAGTIVGLLCAYLQYGEFGQGVHFGWPSLTAAIALGGLVFGILSWRGVRMGPWGLLLITFIGAIPDSTLWEGAGSFFLVAALMNFTIKSGVFHDKPGKSAN